MPLYWTKAFHLAAFLALVGCGATVPQRPGDVTPTPAAARPAGLPQFQEPTYGPDILVVGDSQVSFGAGVEHLALFGNLARSCGANATQQAALQNFNADSVAALGVRSSTFASWTTRDDRQKAPICDKDKRYGVNAGTYGVTGTGRTYVQIGEGQPYDFCRDGQSPMEAMFRDGYYQPKLVVLALVGNSVDRWADPAAAREDMQKVISQLPPESACVVMTTAPAFDADITQKRVVAQGNLAQAVAETGGRCSFAPGLSNDVVRDITGNTAFFRTNDAGEVVDRLHPNAAGFSRFFDGARPGLCRAVFEQIGAQ